MISSAVEAAMSPDISPQRDNSPNPVAHSLILWQEDDDPTEKRPAIVVTAIKPKLSTLELPAIHDYAEAVLDAIAHAPRTHSLEREVLKEPRDTWLL